jgi:hypothetical protein
MEDRAKWLIAGALAVATGVAIYSVVGGRFSKPGDSPKKPSNRVASLAVPAPPKPKGLS